MNKSSLGVARIDEAIPWDDRPYAKSNANTFVHAHAFRVFQPYVSSKAVSSRASASMHPIVPMVMHCASGHEALHRGICDESNHPTLH